MYDMQKQLDDPYYLLLRNVIESEAFSNKIGLIKLQKVDDNFTSVDNSNIDAIIAIGAFSSGKSLSHKSQPR